jgi:hypothetical protein
MMTIRYVAETPKLSVIKYYIKNDSMRGSEAILDRSIN